MPDWKLGVGKSTLRPPPVATPLYGSFHTASVRELGVVTKSRLPEDLARSYINRMILISLPILLGHIVNLFFAATLYYFWMGFLAVAVLAVANTVYSLIGERSTRKQVGVEVRRLTRNLLIVFCVMAPLPFFGVLVIKGVPAIIGWAIGYAAFHP